MYSSLFRLIRVFSLVISLLFNTIAFSQVTPIPSPVTTPTEVVDDEATLDKDADNYCKEEGTDWCKKVNDRFSVSIPNTGDDSSLRNIGIVVDIAVLAVSLFMSYVAYSCRSAITQTQLASILLMGVTGIAFLVGDITLLILFMKKMESAKEKIQGAVVQQQSSDSSSALSGTPATAPPAVTPNEETSQGEYSFEKIGKDGQKTGETDKIITSYEDTVDVLKSAKTMLIAKAALIGVAILGFTAAIPLAIYENVKQPIGDGVAICKLIPSASIPTSPILDTLFPKAYAVDAGLIGSLSILGVGGAAAVMYAYHASSKSFMAALAAPITRAILAGTIVALLVTYLVITIKQIKEIGERIEVYEEIIGLLQILDKGKKIKEGEGLVDPSGSPIVGPTVAGDMNTPSTDGSDNDSNNSDNNSDNSSNNNLTGTPTNTNLDPSRDNPTYDNNPTGPSPRNDDVFSSEPNSNSPDSNKSALCSCTQGGVTVVNATSACQAQAQNRCTNVSSQEIKNAQLEASQIPNYSGIAETATSATNEIAKGKTASLGNASKASDIANNVKKAMGLKKALAKKLDKLGKKPGDSKKAQEALLNQFADKVNKAIEKAGGINKIASDSPYGDVGAGGGGGSAPTGSALDQLREQAAKVDPEATKNISNSITPSGSNGNSEKSPFDDLLGGTIPEAANFSDKDLENMRSDELENFSGNQSGIQSDKINIWQAISNRMIKTGIPRLQNKKEKSSHKK